MRTLLIAVLAAIAFCWSAFTCFAEEARTVVILDTTAQMAANIGQKRKLDTAKSTISAAVSGMHPASPFALWAFGTTPQKKCEDTSELVPLQATRKAVRTLEKTLSGLQPKAARAPALGAVQAALKSVGADGKPVSIILIAGTGDDCIGDICSAAGQLHDEYPSARLTVFGMNMSEQAAANFACAAKAMGGAFTAVKSGADLDRSIKQAFSASQTTGQTKTAAADENKEASGATEADEPEKTGAATTANAPPPADQPAQKEPEEEKAVQPPQPEPNVVLSATLVSGMPPLEAGVTWEIYKVQVTPTGQLRAAEAPFWVGGGGQARAKLPEGRYSVHVAYGLASGAGEFTAGADRIEKTIALDAGTIAVEALQASAGPVASDAFFILYKQKTSAAREELSRSSGAPALFHLNAGDYVLSAFAGPAKLESSVRVTAGKVSVVRMALNVGTLEIKTFARQGSPELVAAWHQISPVSTETKKDVRPPLWLSGSSHRLQLPAGSYRVETVYGNAREESTITVTAGQVTPLNVILNAGEVSLSSSKSERVCAIYESGDDRKSNPVGRGAGVDIRFILRAGRYDLECRKKGEAGSKKQTGITVVAGEIQSAKIED